ncbi:SAM-dependent methyltransferase [Ruminococcus sp. HUN007]|uniref:SAM-dependent methyltransferase n=1 Tax=Ruminococcus sp. HUN007 TaxID=1514668 RepID=UPI0005D1B8E8|nr:SAM-dependent methyltransferase [Ruminococcus sp. HUN007]
MLSKYVVIVAGDLVFTENWLSNMITIAKSDNKIGMINPVSSNVSNFQQIDFEFNDEDEMHKIIKRFNISNPQKWQERLRIVTLGTLFTKECLYAIGIPLHDVGFIHNFGDDDITFRVRRAGYKAILAGDTWIHHDHEKRNCTIEQAQKINNDLAIGRQNFREKYFGIDAWDDVNNFIPEILPLIKPPVDKDNCNILGIDIRCGTPILEIKNHLRQYDIFDATCCAITSEGKYFIDLQTFCGTDNVFTCSPADASDHFKQEVFDYIIIGENINEYPEPFKIIRHVYSLLKKGGQMFVYLKNNYDIYTFLNVIGHRQVRSSKYSLNLTIEQFLEQLAGMDIKSEVVGVVHHTNVPEEYINEVNNRTVAFVQKEWNETAARLTADKFTVKIEKI